MATPTSPIDTWLLLNNMPLLFRDDGYDNRDTEARESYNHIKTTPLAPEGLEIFVRGRDNSRKQGGLVKIDDTPGGKKWDWKPEGKTGHYELHIELPDYPATSALVFVHPGLISQKREASMMADLRTMQDFLFLLGAHDSKKAISQVLDGDVSPLREYEQIKYIIDNLRPIIAAISHHPHSTLQQEHQQLYIHEIRKFSSKVVPQWQNVLPHPPSSLTTLSLEYLPETWIVTHTTVKYDVYENRLLKQFIQDQLLPKLSLISEQARKEIDYREKERERPQNEIHQRSLEYETGKSGNLKKWIDTEIKMIDKLKSVRGKCQQMTQECSHWLNLSFLLMVGSISVPLQVTQVLLKNPLYYRFYRLYLEFQQTLALNLDTEHFSSQLRLRQMSGIYQVWSVFSLTRTLITKLLQNDYEPLDPRRLFYEAKKNYFHFDLRGNVTEIILTKGTTRVAIKYEPRYPYYKDIGSKSGLVAKSTRLGLTPDMAVEVYQGEQVSHLAFFDAKYKWAAVGKLVAFKDEDEESLWKYIKGIEYKPLNSSGQKLVEIPAIACILYPGTVLDWAPLDQPIGALPLIPNIPLDITKNINQAIDEILSLIGLIS